jgi:MoaA/NifB/PqqE/SkfB family radical SAM enzyme
LLHCSKELRLHRHRFFEPFPRGARLKNVHTSLRRLPLVTLYLTERCNSRCVTCDYWRYGRTDMTLDAVANRLPSLLALHTRVVLISGGEPLMNPQWLDIARLLQESGLKLWLLTSGLALAKHARSVGQVFDAVTVSLDGTSRATYAAIRGLDAFEKVCQGIRAAASAGARVGLRVTLQRANYRELPAFVELAHATGARQISFLPVDVANPHAFARRDDYRSDLALRQEDLPVFRELLRSLEQDRAADFRSGFIAESPDKMRRILQYFAAICGQDSFPPVRCNAPEFSAVVNATGHVQPCFFIPSPTAVTAADLEAVLNRKPMQDLRAAIRAGDRPECRTCVCSMWRDLDTVDDSLLSAVSDEGIGPRIDAEVVA